MTAAGLLQCVTHKLEELERHARHESGLLGQPYRPWDTEGEEKRGGQNCQYNMLEAEGEVEVVTAALHNWPERVVVQTH
jgi:hypothetical protein